MREDLRRSEIRVVVCDVDGVLTDGKIRVGPSGEIYKTFHSRDGYAMETLIRKGIHFGILSASNSREILEARFEAFSPSFIASGVVDKLDQLKIQLDLMGFSLKQTAYVGDSVADLRVLEEVGFPFCPADASAEVKQVAHILKTAGGQGVLLEIVQTQLEFLGC
jgi:3-deoxy-D-manno-octulosonate 8-phosphate phosphatase (KDO 8-P phosphatase)